MLKLKSFIYRFSNIFGLHIFLAEKEEQEYIDSLKLKDIELKHMHRGLWQASNGFVTVWTYKQGPVKSFIARIKNAFNF